MRDKVSAALLAVLATALVAAAPEGKGFPVRFDGFSLTAVGP